jgi:hypothetical protein
LTSGENNRRTPARLARQEPNHEAGQVLFREVILAAVLGSSVATRTSLHLGHRATMPIGSG